MDEDRHGVDPYRYGEVRRGPLRDFIPNLRENWRDKTPLSAWDFGVACHGLNYAILFCALPGLGLLIVPLVLGTFYSLCRRRYSTGDVQTWAYWLFLISTTSLCLLLQVIGLGLALHLLNVPILVCFFVSTLLSQFGQLYMRYRGGPFGLTDGREWREPGSLQFFIDQFKINRPVERDTIKRPRPVAEAAEKTDT